MSRPSGAVTVSHPTDFLPGRLGNPHASLEHDPRADPRIIAALKAVDGFGPVGTPVADDASYEECLAYCAEFEAVSAAGHPALLAAMPQEPDVVSSTETIRGEDGNAITLYLHKPTDVEGPLPCIYHTHGGGMVMMSATDPMFVRVRNRLAAMGLVVVGVEFRNGGGRLGNHPFPAGLTDCSSGLRWVHERRDDLGISGIVISGESGGGNLAIATTLNAKEQGWLDHIDGVYAMCPYIYGGYARPAPDLLSLTENDGYMLSCPQMAAIARVYDPEGRNAANPLAWPYQAGVDDLAGLPPHVISVNELDPLRDEGLAFYRKLLAAGVPAVARTVHGTPHAGDLAFPDVTPEIYAETTRSICGFAYAVAGQGT
jgi:acetyl esterase/lipase